MVKTQTTSEKIRLAHSLTQQLLAMAKNNQWEEFENKLRERDNLLEKLKNKDTEKLSQEEQIELGNLFEEIRTLQTHIIELAKKAHAETKNLLKDSQKSNKAVKSYQANR